MWYYPGSALGQEAATSVLDEMVTTSPSHRNREIKEGDLVVLRETRMPAILVECEFITNPKQLRFLDNLDNQLGLAEAISEGVDALGW